WGGAGLILLGMVLVLPRIVPFVETFLYTPSIPTAPPLVITPTQANNPIAAMPAEVEPTTEPTEVTPTSTPIPGVTPRATLEPEPTATPTAIWTGTKPANIVIPSIDLDAPVVSIGWTIEKVDGQDQAVWDVPDYRAAGWHDTSGLLGVTGNAVLNGHNTLKGEVFRYLYRVEIGAQIFVEGKDGEVYVYRVGEKYILREAGQSLEVRLENARYIQDTPDERLTLVTCHPYGSLENRLVLIAYPDASDHLGNGAS
ncbi:MAG: sortase, partial [Anaerolineae bacterium]|nr:sortase [Anaerolineae bacterium]